MEREEIIMQILSTKNHTVKIQHNGPHTITSTIPAQFSKPFSGVATLSNYKPIAINPVINNNEKQDKQVSKKNK